MTTINARIWRSGLSLATICLFVVTHGPAGIAILESIAGHVHRAFWCAAIEFAALGPIRVIRYLVDDLRDLDDVDGQPGLLRRLSLDIPYYLWMEVAWSKYRRWVQLFVVHGSLSPTPALHGDLSSEAALFQGASYYCIIQVVADINGILTTLTRAADREAHNVRANADPMLGGSGGFLGCLSGRLPYARLAGQALLCRLLFHVFLAMGAHLGRMAVGSWVAVCVDAYHAGPASTFLVFTAVTVLLFVAVTARTITVEEEALWEEEDEARREAREYEHVLRRIQLWEAREAEAAGEEEDRQALAEFLGRLERAQQEGQAEAEARQDRLLRETQAAVPAAAAGGGDDAAILELEARLVTEMDREGEGRQQEQERELRRLRRADERARGRPRTPPPPRPRRRVPELADVLLPMFVCKWAAPLAWLAVEAARLLLGPWRPRLLRHHRFLCPELAALWSAGDRRGFLADVLAGDPGSAAIGASLVALGALRPRDYEDLWRAAGLTTDFVLGDGGEAGAAAAAAVGISTRRGGWLLRPLTMVTWGGISWALVSGVEVAFGLCVVAGVVAAIYLKWPGETRSRKRRGRARV